MNVVSIGEILVDWLSLTPGASLLDATKFCRSLGGNATNVAIGLQRLETPVKLIGKIGTDFHAEYLKLMLHNEGMSLDWIIEDDQHPTAQCFMTTSADGEHTYRNWP